MGDKVIASVKAFVNGFYEGIGKAVEWVANLIPKMLKMFGFEEQAKFVEEVIADVKEYVIEIYDSLKEAFSGLVKIFEKAVHWVEDNWDDIKLVISTIWDTVKEYASLMFDGVKQIFSGIRAIFSAAFEWVEEHWDEIKAVIDTVWTAVKNAASAMFEAVSTIFTGIKAIFSFAFEWVEEHWDEIKAVIDTVWTGVKKVASAMFEGVSIIFSGIKAIFSFASEWVEENWDTISEAIDTVWTGVKKVVSSFFSFYKSIFTGIKAVFEGVMAFFSSDDDEEKEDKIQAMKDAFTNMKEKLFGIFTSIGEALISFVGLLKLPPLSELIPDISKAISSFTSFLGDMVKKGLSAVKDKMMFWKKNKKSEDLEEEVVMTPPLDNSYEVSYDPASDIPIVTQTEKIGTGTIQTALNPVPEIPMVLQSAGNPTPATGNIVGLGYESVTQASTMQLAQQSLNQSKGETTYSGGGGNVNAANVNNSTNIQNTSVNNAPMPSSFDASDRSTSAPPAYMILR